MKVAKLVRNESGVDQGHPAVLKNERDLTLAELAGIAPNDAIDY